MSSAGHIDEMQKRLRFNKSQKEARRARTEKVRLKIFEKKYRHNRKKENNIEYTDEQRQLFRTKNKLESLHQIKKQIISLIIVTIVFGTCFYLFLTHFVIK